jgi:hypothetical protein
MSNYNLKPIVPRSLASQEKKAARKKLLEEVRARRRKIYTRFRKRTQEVYTDLEENGGY